MSTTQAFAGDSFFVIRAMLNPDATVTEIGPVVAAVDSERSYLVTAVVREALVPVTGGLVVGTLVGAVAAAAIADRLPVGPLSAGTGALAPPLILLAVASVATALPAARTGRRTDLPAVLR